MVSRRQSLQLAGSAAFAALAGCSADLTATDGPERSLRVDRLGDDPVEYALYELPSDELFGGPARAALDEILPDGRYRTYGYGPLGDGEYVEHEGTYYRTEQFVSGRTELRRPVVRVEPIDEETAPDDAVPITALQTPSARPLKILQSHEITNGDSATTDLLRGDSYVMTRPAERESRLAAGDFDGRVVTRTGRGERAYRVEVRTEQVPLTEHTVLAVDVADSREAFRAVVLGAEAHAVLDADDLPSAAGDVLDDAIGRNAYRETGEPSEAFETVLERLGFDVDESANGHLLWYVNSLFRAAYYVDVDG